MVSLRKFIAVGVALAGVALAPSLANAQTTAYTTADLNLRQGPSTQYSVILAMPQGSQVTINYCANNSSWCQVQFRQYVGWASSRYMTTTPPRYVQAPQPQPHAPVYQPAPPPPPPQHVVQPHPHPPPQHHHYYGWRYPSLQFRFNFWFH